jgi:UDP-N-acetylmuramyl pentapeptide phosphotransferase/UDP-N-acetylglucosamine-1-phosphate transferase
MEGTDGIAIVAGSGVLCGLLTGLSISGCSRFGIVADRPNAVQAVHRRWAPRVGGVPIIATLFAGLALWPSFPERTSAMILFLCALPAFLAGLAEDVHGFVGPRWRLWATFAAAWIAWFALDGKLTSVGVPGLDWVLGKYAIVAFLFTAFAVGGVAHAINIIDGFNGLSACYCLICFAAYFVVATIVGDPLVQGLSLLFCGTLLGFLAWNFPFGRVFLGDGGAYLLGFSLGEISVLLVTRNPEVSPWFCFLVMAYPIWDTLFSYYRREVLRGQSWSAADALHLHHLIYRRLVKPYRKEASGDVVLPNSMTSVYLWGLAILSAVPAVLFWDSTPLLMTFSGVFVVSYGLLYRSLATFRSPKMLRIEARRAARRASPQTTVEYGNQRTLP